MLLRLELTPDVFEAIAITRNVVEVGAQQFEIWPRNGALSLTADVVEARAHIDIRSVHRMVCC